MKKFLSTRQMASAAMIAALYAAVSACMMPLSFGPIQVRAAEALTLTAVFGPVGIAGVTLGCLMTNIIGVFTGANIIGMLDIFFGTAATLIAALMSYGMRGMRLRGLPAAAAVPPILVNAAVVGGELCYAAAGRWNPQIFLASAFSVAAGQAVSCLVLGLLLVMVLERQGIARRFLCA